MPQMTAQTVYNSDVPKTSRDSSFEFTATPLAELDVDLLAMPVWEGEEPSDLHGLDAATGGAIAEARSRGEFRGKAFDLFLTNVVDPGWRARRAMVIGLGIRSAGGADRLRKSAAASVIAARQRRVAQIGFVLRPTDDDELTTQAVAEGLTLGEFDGGRYKTEHEASELRSIQIVAADGRTPGRNERVARGRVLGECSNQARLMANEPGNTLTPQVFAERALSLTDDTGLRVEVIDEQGIAKLNLQLLLGVARGSAEPPRLIVLRHDPPGAPTGPVLGLIGKGVTFDSGGISLKPADAMDQMKDDMAGGAAVICAMRAISVLRAPIRVIGIVPAAENMPGGRAIKPGDVLTSASGTSVEIINTDAEGRLVLGDALWHARQLGATHLVDAATLTGGCVVALGRITAGLFGTPERWLEVVRATAERAGDRAWPLPLFEEYAEQLRSEIADMANTGGRAASAITAALFLKKFTGGLPWAHLDIAGTAWCDELRPFQPKGPTGAAVRTLAEMAFGSDEWGDIA